MKWPRRYAADYIAAGRNKERQKAALAGCPEKWQELVKTHIKITRKRIK